MCNIQLINNSKLYNILNYKFHRGDSHRVFSLIFFGFLISITILWLQLTIEYNSDLNVIFSFMLMRNMKVKQKIYVKISLIINDVNELYWFK